MEQLVRVKETYDNGMALVSRVRESACSGDCHKCSGCGAAQEITLFRAVNAIGARPGELVTIVAKSGPILLSAVVIYIMPLCLFFVGYLLGMLLWKKGSLVGCMALAAGIAGAVAYDRLVARKQKTVYTITGYPTVKILESQIKGDNDLD